MPAKKKRYQPPRRGCRLINNQQSFSNAKKLPRSNEVMKRLRTLQKEKNGVGMKIIFPIVADELRSCWTNQDLPVQKRQTIITKLKRCYAKKGTLTVQ